MTSWQIDVEADYGLPMDADMPRRWARLTRARDPRISSAAEYVAICRRLDPTLSREGGWRADGRLVAVGFGRVPPREWIRGERRDGRASSRTLAHYLTWWQIAAERPDVAGSSCNAVSPAMWFAHVPPHVARALGLRMVRRDGSIRRVTPAIRRAAIAARRASIARSPNGWRVSLRLLSALGHLCPELQAVALRSIDTTRLAARDGTPRQARLADVNWSVVADWQARLHADRTGRVRLALAYRERSNGGVCERFWRLADALECTEEDPTGQAADAA